MKAVLISDTHNYHRELNLPEADMIIHAGDIVMTRHKNAKKDEYVQILDFLEWYSELDYKYKIFIAGNHDFWFETTSHEEIQKHIPKGVTYLNDGGIELGGLKIWGSPVQPYFYDWAFNRIRGSDIRKHWDLIPKGTDILITHGPPVNVLDTTANFNHAGCQDLWEQVKLVRPKIHVFGHIHEAYGQEEKLGISFINASVVNRQYEPLHVPIVVDI